LHFEPVSVYDSLKTDLVGYGAGVAQLAEGLTCDAAVTVICRQVLRGR
jgi:hypothetical protein